MFKNIKQIGFKTLVVFILFIWTMIIFSYSYRAGWDDGSSKIIKTYNQIIDQLEKANKKKTI